MFSQRAFLIALGLSSILSPSSAYMIDESCEKAGIKDMVEAGLQSAFSMAESAKRALEANPYDKIVSSYIEQLFLPHEGKGPKDEGGRRKMGKAYQMYDDILRAYREPTDSPTHMDIVIFCDDSRLVKKQDSKNYRDTSNNVVISSSGRLCKGSVSEPLSYIALAETVNPERTALRPNGIVIEDVATQIQLCDWFIEVLKKNRDFATSEDVARKTKVGMKSKFGTLVIDWARKNWRLPFTQIDAYNLLDKVLLHEMTHGRAAWDQIVLNTRYEGTIDVDTPKDSFGLPIGFGPIRTPAYGWRWAKQLAELGSEVNGPGDWKPDAPDHNADTLALFANVCALLEGIAGTSPKVVMEDGRVTELN